MFGEHEYSAPTSNIYRVVDPRWPDFLTMWLKAHLRDAFKDLIDEKFVAHLTQHTYYFLRSLLSNSSFHLMNSKLPDLKCNLCSRGL